MHRVAILLLLAAFPALAFDRVDPGYAIRLPHDAGAHPGHRIEWWYVTGNLDSGSGPLGFQVTFFRVRNREAEDQPGRFSAKQILFAHAALADPREGRLLTDERMARALPPLVEARTGETHVRIDDWSLVREPNTYRTRIAADTFTLALTFTPTQAVLLQGERGFSRKGPGPQAASHYYSEPHLRVAGHVERKGTRTDVSGTAWLDHEWSSEMLASDAIGWDWIGVNLDDGSALMAFRIRKPGGEKLWAGGTLRKPNGETRALQADAIAFAPRRQWKSPRSGASYPVAMDVTIDGETWKLEPLLDDQELDARGTIGTMYWEGAVRATGPRGERGRGYLELTGYAGRPPL
jgi:predicted secreted hydrolase